MTDAIPDTEIIGRLSLAPPLQRLRRVKQLGFASLEYSGADHSRFSHALGTMHVMRRLLQHLEDVDPEFIDALVAAVAGPSETARAVATQHLLVAALLQDCGELPYGQSTKDFFRPDDEIILSVSEMIGEAPEHVATWPSKPIFTLACLAQLQRDLDPLDVAMVAYLITGHLWKTRNASLYPVMQLLDGVVDSDRIDYVARDAHHTGLGSIDVESVVRSIVEIDDNGPTCDDPAAVAELLALRAHLYSTVYLSGKNRSRVLLLKELLEALLGCAPCLRDEVFDQADIATPAILLNYEQFLRLDDVSIDTIIESTRLAKYRKLLSQRGQTALDALASDPSGITERWLSSFDQPENVPPIHLPVKVFAEYFVDGTRNDQRLVRVRMASNPSLVVPLSSLNGPYASVTIQPRVGLPMRGDVLVVEPTGQRLPQEYCDALRDGTLGAAIKAGLVQRGGIDEPDTIAEPGFEGPSVFISYCIEDLPVVAAIVQELRRRKRKYYLIAGQFQGVGGSPGENSSDAPVRTDACIMIVSVAYQDRLEKRPQGNIARELQAAITLRAKKGYPIVPLATCHQNLLTRMPWGLMGFDETPFVGSVLHARDVAAISDAIREALARVDREVGGPCS